MTMLGSSAGVVVQMDDKSSSSCLTQSRRHWETGVHHCYHEKRSPTSTREKITCIVNTLFSLLATLPPLYHIVVPCETVALVSLLVKEKQQIALFNLVRMKSICFSSF